MRNIKELDGKVFNMDVELRCLKNAVTIIESQTIVAVCPKCKHKTMNVKDRGYLYPTGDIHLGSCTMKKIYQCLTCGTKWEYKTEPTEIKDADK